MKNSITPPPPPQLFCIELDDGSIFETEVSTTDPAYMTSWDIMKEIQKYVATWMSFMGHTKPNVFNDLSRLIDALERRYETLVSFKPENVQVNKDRYELRRMRTDSQEWREIQRPCYYSIIETTMIRQKTKVREDGKTYSGWRIYFTGYSYTTYDQNYKPNSSVFKKDFQHVLLVNETVHGVRLMWVDNKTKTPLWGRSDVNIKEFTRSLWRGPMFNAINQAYLLLQSIYPPKEVLPILEYIHPETYPMNTAPGLQLYGIGQRDLKVLSAWKNEGQNIKNLLNSVYGKSGIDGLSKNSFRSLSHIYLLRDLKAAIDITRTFKLLPASFFNDINISNWSKISDKREIPYFIKTFVHNNKTGISSKKIMDDILALLRTDEDGRYNTRELEYLFRDSVVMFKQIPRGRARSIVIDHIRNQKLGLTDLHDYITIEALKYQGVNKKLSYPKKLKEFHNQQILPNITFHIAEDTHTLAEWGGVQNNCIGTYGDRVINNSIYVVGFKDITTGYWIGHSSLMPGTFEPTQLLGKHNARLEEDLDKSIRKWMKENLQNTNNTRERE